MTPEEILAFVAEVEGRANKATPEQWAQDGTYVVDEDGNAIASTIWNDYSDEELAIVTREKNACFMAKARADVPRLCQIVREQAAETADLRERLTKLEKGVTSLYQAFTGPIAYHNAVGRVQALCDLMSASKE